MFTLCCENTLFQWHFSQKNNNIVWFRVCAYTVLNGISLVLYTIPMNRNDKQWWSQFHQYQQNEYRTTEHKKDKKYDIWKPCPCLRQVQMCDGVKSVIDITPTTEWILLMNTIFAFKCYI
jgi:hypothetical protein